MSNSGLIGVKRVLELEDGDHAMNCSKKFKETSMLTPKEVDTNGIDEENNWATSNNDFKTDNEEDFEFSAKGSKAKLLINEINQQNEDPSIHVGILKNKLDVYENKLHKAKQVNKNLNSTFTCKIEEKDRLISNLQLFIDEQEARHRRVLDARGGEDAEVFFNVSKPLHRFVLEVKSLQSEKANLMIKYSQLEIDKNEIQTKYLNLEHTMKNDHVLLSEYNLLLTELEVLRQNQINWKKNQDKENINQCDPSERAAQMKVQLNNNLINELRNEMRVKEKEHFDAVTKLHGENHCLRKKLSALENKYTILAFTPPKLKVKEVVDVDTEEKLDELKSETLELQSELRNSKRQLLKINEDSVSLITQNEKHKTNEKYLSEELDAQKEQLQELNKQLKENKLNYDTQLRKKENELIIFQEGLEIREETIKKKLQAQIDELTLESQSKISSVESVSAQLKGFLTCLKEFKCFKTEISNHIIEMKNFYNNSMMSFKNNLLNVIESTRQKSDLLAQRYSKEIQLRKKIHNQLVELRGNIRVFCRVRPLISEDGEHASNVVTFNEIDDSLIYVEHKDSKKKFDVDKVFPPHVSQTEVFESVKSLINSCLDGYNVCIFAYGQTGSGKTYTMEGTSENPGINQQALQLLFRKSAELTDWEYTILVSFVEIYNETLIDLLNTEPCKLDIKQQGKYGVHVPGLTHITVTGLAEVNEVFSHGCQNRTVAATAMNERSSRSHSVLTVTAIGNNTITGTHVEGKLNLVDLAGSERISKSGSEGVRLKEAQCINKSLSALGDVIHALKNKNQHIPYRNTKLTYLLQQCLSGDSKTLMMVQLSPADKNASETFCSLNFAQRVRSVELGKAVCSVAKN